MRGVLVKQQRHLRAAKHGPVREPNAVVGLVAMQGVDIEPVLRDGNSWCLDNGRGRALSAIRATRSQVEFLCDPGLVVVRAIMSPREIADVVGESRTEFAIGGSHRASLGRARGNVCGLTDRQHDNLAGSGARKTNQDRAVL